MRASLSSRAPENQKTENYPKDFEQKRNQEKQTKTYKANNIGQGF